MSAGDQFIYTSLEDPHNHFRLLTLKPAPRREDEIECSLKTYNLGDAPKYQALSYVWGTPNFDHDISVNGKHFQITRSLCCALRDFRKVTRPRLLWVDGICINQSKDAFDERGAQVTVMAKIYSQASMVIAWLGEESLDIINALDDLNIPRYKSKVSNAQGMKKEPSGSKAAMHLSTLSQLPWWQRLWTVQEAVLSKRFIFMVGSWKIKLDAVQCMVGKYYDAARDDLNKKYDELDFVKLASEAAVQQAYKSWENLQIALLTLSSNLTTLIDVREKYQDGLRSELIDLLGRYRGSSYCASDPRDRIFAIFGLSEDAKTKPASSYLRAKYTFTVEETYLRFATTFIKEKSSLEILMHAGGTRNLSNSSRTTLPSWVPDWRDDRDTKNIHIETRTWRVFSAGGNSEIEFSHHNSSHSSSYNFKGVRIGSLKTMLRLPLEVHRGEFIEGIHRMMISETEGDASQHHFLPEIGAFYHQMHSLLPHMTVSELLRIISLDICFVRGTYIRIGSKMQTHFYDSIVRSKKMEWPSGGSTDPEAEIEKQAFHFSVSLAARQIESNVRKYPIATTSDDNHALVPGNAEEGDIVVVLFGGNMPFLLRPSGESYSLIGVVYVDNYMDGQAIEQLVRGERTSEIFSLV